MMRKTILKDILILLLTIGVIFIICLLLPEKVPIHFNTQGKADIVVNKYFLLFGAVIPYSLYWQFLHRHKGMSTYLYIRIAHKLKYAILNGSYQPGQQLPSVRLIAKQENHNPVTIHHALKDLEQQGLIFTQRSRGYFVIGDPLQIAVLHRQECMKLTRDFLDKFHALGCSNI